MFNFCINSWFLDSLNIRFLLFTTTQCIILISFLLFSDMIEVVDNYFLINHDICLLAGFPWSRAKLVDKSGINSVAESNGDSEISVDSQDHGNGNVKGNKSGNLTKFIITRTLLALLLAVFLANIASIRRRKNGSCSIHISAPASKFSQLCKLYEFIISICSKSPIIQGTRCFLATRALRHLNVLLPDIDHLKDMNYIVSKLLPYFTGLTLSFWIILGGSKGFKNTIELDLSHLDSEIRDEVLKKVSEITDHSASLNEFTLILPLEMGRAFIKAINR